MARVPMSSSSQTTVRRGAQGSITRLPSGSLRVRVYAGPDPLTGRPHYIGETIADGPLAREQAEETCRRLLSQVRRRSSLHSHATVDDLLNRHLAMAHIGERSRRSHQVMAAKHLRPFLGHLPLRAMTPEKHEHTPHPEPQSTTVAEAARILGEAWKDPDLGPLVWLAMATGARRGELCALR